MRSLFHSDCTIFDYFFREAYSVHWSTWFISCNINFCFTWFFLQISTSAWQMPVHVMQALYAPTPTVPTLVPAATASQEMGHTVKVTSPSYCLLRCVSKKIQDWIFKSERIRKWILRFFTKQINPRSFGSWFVKETEVATTRLDYSRLQNSRIFCECEGRKRLKTTHTLCGLWGSRASHSRITLTALPAFRKRPKTTVLQSRIIRFLWRTMIRQILDWSVQ